MFKIEENKIAYYENEKELAYVTYPIIYDRIVNINHTVVDPILQGRGIASKLLEYAYNDIKAKGLKAELSCSYAISWFNKHSNYQDILTSGRRKYHEADFARVYQITKDHWENEVPMSLELANFIYDFLVRYYLYYNEYCYVGLEKGNVAAFLLANLKEETNDSFNYFKENINKLNDNDKKLAYEYYDYINDNHNKVLSYMPKNSIYLGLIASKIHGMGFKMIEYLKGVALKNNVHEIYLWTDETCDYKYYEKLGCILLETYYISLYEKKLKTFIYKMNF